MSRQRVIRGIVFDKDGTLLDFDATWMPAFRRIANHASGGDEALGARLLAIGGFCERGEYIKSDSLFASGNSCSIAEAWEPHVAEARRNGLARMIEEAFLDEGARHSCALFDVAALFTRLKASGMTIGIASSDSERGIRNTLGGMNVLPLIDYYCGYDSGLGFKPEAGMIEGFCTATGLAAYQIAVVGDNPHDLEMGRNAGVALNIGVLSGNSTAAELAPLADEILPSAQEIGNVIPLETPHFLSGKPRS